jgi:hypothetical protein
VAEKWENNAWKEDAFTESDRNFMEFANEHLEVVWENFRQALEPQIEDSNLFPAVLQININGDASLSCVFSRESIP